MMLVKLGGSVITDKSRYRTFRPEAVHRLAKEMAGSGQRLLVVHGAGSYGHVIAKKYDLHMGRKRPGQEKGVAHVSWDVRELDTLVIEALVHEGLDAVSLVPGSCTMLSDGKLTSVDLDKFRRYYDMGVTPVTFGDVALDDRREFGICSGDQMMEALAREFRPERAIFVTDVDGVFSCDPHLDTECHLIDEIDQSTLSSLPRSERCDDVTGSIYAKIEYMLGIASFAKECLIINGNVPGRLAAALRGELPLCSRVRGGKV
ncbi:MAG: Isopentenyl phosphate kinase [Methanomassiliicoccales archaeon PtaU1.Bin124]|nr:MAG: Isopentenyl phosphate kinase [Methanomassiliicoccales archaeon PtaU1.Bin124]